MLACFLTVSTINSYCCITILMIFSIPIGAHSRKFTSHHFHRKSKLMKGKSRIHDTSSFIFRHQNFFAIQSCPWHSSKGKKIIITSSCPREIRGFSFVFFQNDTQLPKSHRALANSTSNSWESTSNYASSEFSTGKRFTFTNVGSFSSKDETSADVR